MHPKANEKLRTKFKEKIRYYERQGRTIIYLDESGFAYDMPRRGGYALQGERCYGSQDWHAKGRLNAIGALIGSELLTVCFFDANIDSDIFYAWLTKDLLPKIKGHAVIVMDNATFHKRKDAREAIEKDHHTLLFMPPYSPDLNPIEHKWAQLKALRRKLRCTIFELFSYI